MTACSGILPHLGLLRFSGVDAAQFLQGQVSNDTRRLTAGSPLLAAYSSPQGRVLAILHLLPHSTGPIAILPRELLEATAERLRKFVLRSKVKIEDLDGAYAVAGLHRSTLLDSAGITPPTPARPYVESTIGIARVAPAKDRYWVIGEPARLAALGLGADTAAVSPVERDWRLADIRDGLPQVYAATSEQFVAQMLNLDLIDGISFSKGCYTGQEIVARTQHLGRIKRRMMRIRLPDPSPGAPPLTIGQTLRLTDGRGARLTEVADGDEAREALAVVNLESTDAADGGGAGGGAVQLTLPYDLAAPA